MLGLVVFLVVLAIGFVIFVHELGHFLFAKWAGVKVERFSIGMGPVIWSKKVGETEYAISLLPVGGYVAMLGQSEVPGEVVDTESENSFAVKHPAWRAAILSAGVLFNLISSYIILLALAFYGTPINEPVVGHVVKEFRAVDDSLVLSPAYEVGLRPGDRILTVNGVKIRSFNDVVMNTISSADDPIVLEVERDGATLRLPKTGTGVLLRRDENQGRPALGILPAVGLKIGRVVAAHGVEMSADAPKAGERVIGIEGSNENFDELRFTGQQAEERLLPFIGKDVGLRMQASDGTERVASCRYAGMSAITDAALGLPVRIDHVAKGSPAAVAGMQAGDVVEQIDGQAVAHVEQLRALVRASVAEKRSVQIGVMRYENGIWARKDMAMQADYDESIGRMVIGVRMSAMRVGSVPFLPKTLGTDVSPLEQAGIKAGEIIIGIDTIYKEEGTEIERIEARVLSAGTIRSLSCNKTAWDELTRSRKVHPISRLVGMKNTPSIVSKLAGGRVSGTADSALITLPIEKMTGAQADSVDVSLERLGGTLMPYREQLMALKQNEWIADSYSWTDKTGGNALAIITPAVDATVRTVSLRVQDVGVAFGFTYEERPYQISDWTEAFSVANAETGSLIGGTLKIIPRLFQPASSGGIDASSSLSGPIGIFSMMMSQLQENGFASMLKFTALIGVNLFLINLMPIPMVDGGQLLFLGVETILRRPIPERLKLFLNNIGFIAIIALMLFVVALDIGRQIG